METIRMTTGTGIDIGTGVEIASADRGTGTAGIATNRTSVDIRQFKTRMISMTTTTAITTRSSSTTKNPITKSSFGD